MIIFVRKNKKLDEKLEGAYKKRFDDLSDKDNTNNLSENEEAERQVLYMMDMSNQTFNSSNPDKLSADEKNKLNIRVKNYIQSSMSGWGEQKGGDPFVNPSQDSIEKTRERIPDASKDTYKFFKTLNADKNPAFVSAIEGCLKETTANSLYWLLVDFMNAPNTEKIDVVNKSLGDALTLQGEKQSRKYPNIRALLREEGYVKKFIKMYEPYAGQRPPKGAPLAIPQKKSDDEEQKQANNTKETEPSDGNNPVPKPQEDKKEETPSEETPSEKKEKEDKKNPEEDKSEKDKQPKEDDKEPEDDEVFIYFGNTPVEPKKAASYKRIRIENGTLNIQPKAFQGMKNVKDVVWFDKKQRKTGLFRTGDNSARLYSDSLPLTVQNIYEYGFSGCSSLKN